MKSILATAALITITTIFACTKDSSPVANAVPHMNSADASMQQLAGLAMTQARLSGTQYSQSISLDTANKMLGSYLTSVGYPTVDTAIRSLSFDADTLRAYLQDRDIVTLKFMFAHQPEYANSSKNGKFAGMTPGVLTMIVVGLNDDQQHVLNTSGGVYEHFMNCPTICPDGVNSPYIY